MSAYLLNLKKDIADRLTFLKGIYLIYFSVPINCLLKPYFEFFLKEKVELKLHCSTK